MDNITIVAIVSIVISGITTAIGVFAPSLAEGRAVAAAMESLAQQPDASPTITRTLFERRSNSHHPTLFLVVVVRWAPDGRGALKTGQ